MSENEKNENAAAEGVTASGGIGGVTDPAAGILGNVPTANYGVTTGPNAVNPTGVPGGILAPEQSRRFLDYVWDATVLAQDGRRFTMRANTAEIDKVNVGERVIRAANQADGNYVNAGATFTKVELTTKKIRLDWEIATEALEDNLEGAALEDHLVRLMTNALANDIEDLAINADGATGAFLSILPSGFSTQVQTTGDAHEAVVTVADGAWTPEVLDQIVLALPRKYRAIKSGLKFYVSTDTFHDVAKANGTDTVNAISTESNRQRFLDGSDQTVGNARQQRVLGFPVMEVPYFPDDYVELTFPANRIWGFQRDVTVHREYKIKKDTIEYTVYLRFGIAWEELDAVAFADAASDATT